MDFLQAFAARRMLYLGKRPVGVGFYCFPLSGRWDVGYRRNGPPGPLLLYREGGRTPRILCFSLHLSWPQWLYLSRTPNSFQKVIHKLYKKDVPDNYNIELFLVADKAEFQRHGENLDKTRQHLMTIAHHLNQIFLKISFQIFLVGIEIWTEENKANVSETASSTLLEVLEWRRQHLLPRKHHDNMQLISGKQFKNHALGEAFVAKMCTPDHSGGVIKDTGVSPKELAKYVAHEMGHNLGMDHDTDSCYCPAGSGKCLLSRRTGYNMNEDFSDCSFRFLCRFLEEKDVTCLMDRPETYIDEPIKRSHPYQILETVGMVSLGLCCLIFLLLFAIIWKKRFCRRTETKRNFTPVHPWNENQILSI
ncbi:disintegrin and metallo ase domain-containing 12 [Pelobates cultripes]|uniref:Disintegrin and metallo ase domain-containing 12 n=1 Tax=Pelobates cultripes TaxID=61616 RepID=A0AAD1SEM6_PELCU|nr:disintegrin and metallo ase domain-containing 12 [Pelobates cultripes]